MRGKASSRGFTLVELLIVVFILGLLAVVALGKFEAAKDKGYLATLKADLKNLAIHEELYYSDFANYSYSTNLTTLAFVPSAGVTVTVLEGTGTGWSARATHSASPWSCALFYGSANALAPATQPGVIACAKP